MAANRRTEILQAAARTVSRRGVRGLRVEELSTEAGVSTSLIYYYFKDRAGLLRETLEHVNQRAGRYTEESLPAGAGGREEAEMRLLLELQEAPEVVENSLAWGELRASAVFERDLQGPLRHSTAEWIAEIAAAIARGQRQGTVTGTVEPGDAAERLTALVEGLSERWHSGTLSLERALELMRGAIERELGEPPAERA